MPFKYCFYIHHHGSGHVMRAIAIAKAFPAESITFMGSDLMRYAAQIPDHIACIHLPMDTHAQRDTYDEQRDLTFLHYAPLHVPGVLNRIGVMHDYFQRNPTTMLIVDVSVEVTLFARLCGIPTVVIRQHGRRTDLAHRLAYESAELIIAPFSRNLDAAEDNPAMSRTYYAGGFSRYTGKNVCTDSRKKDVAIFIGQGGSNINSSLIRHLRTQINNSTHLHIIGEVSDQIQLENTHFHGHIDCPEEVLSTCDVVICNAGHNTVMELADLRKRMICIPAERPFNEQLQKAYHLEQAGCAITVLEEQVYRINWEDYITRARELDEQRLNSLTDQNAITKIKVQLDNLSERLLCTTLKQMIHE